MASFLAHSFGATKSANQNVNLNYLKTITAKYFEKFREHIKTNASGTRYRGNQDIGRKD